MLPSLRTVILQPTLAQRIAMLFRAGEQGAWYDFSDITTLYQDSAGTTPVTAVEQPVGKVSDKSGCGNHLIQATASKRPTLSARVNLLTYSEDFSNAAWTKRGTCTITANQAVAPDGTTTADLVSGLNTTLNDVYQQVTVPAGGYVPSVFIKRVTTVGTFYIQNPANAANGRWTVNLALLPDDFVEITQSHAAVTVVAAFTSSGTASEGLHLQGASGGPLSFYVWGASCATQATRYQRISAATDYDTAGFLRKETLDGVDDAQATTTGGGASTSAMIVMGFKSTLAGAAQTLWTDRTGNTGLKLEKTAANVIAFSGGNGASINTATGDAIVIGTNYVVTALYDGINLSVQLNSAAPVTAACTLSAGQAAITMGADTGAAAAFFKGDIYEVLYVKDDVQSVAQIASAKRFVASKSGVTL